MADDNNAQASAPVKPRKARRLRSFRVDVQVDEERVQKAIARNSRHCFIAEAIKEALPNVTSILVDLQSIRFTVPEKRLRYVYLTPMRCCRALVDFDRGQKPEPFSFTLSRASTITRVASGAPNEKTPEARAARNKAVNRAGNQIRDQIGATADAPYKPPAEYVNRVVEAMDDPTANLGPAIVVERQNGNDASRPTFVGGLPPRHAGNIQRTRRFGLRELSE